MFTFDLICYVKPKSLLPMLMLALLINGAYNILHGE